MDDEQARYEVTQTDGHVAVTTYHAAGGVSYRTGFQTKEQAFAWIKQAEAADAAARC